MKIGYYINDRFVLDNGEDAGVNVMLFSGPKLDYFFDEYRCDSVKEAEEYIKQYDGEMVEVKLKHPIGNRRYSLEEYMGFKDLPENETIFHEDTDNG